MSNSKDKNPDTLTDVVTATQFAGIPLSTTETVFRYGSANTEFLKGFTGVDKETGQVFAKSLDEIGQGKLHPDYIDINRKQQAGYAAEVAATSRDNAEAIIGRTGVRTTRSDDLPQFGKNHSVVDRVKVLNGNIIEGTQTQMKFVGDRDQLFDRIANEDGKFSRYRGIILELPSEQFEGAREHCQKKAQELRTNAQAAERAGRPSEVVSKLRQEAANYDQLADNLADSGLTTDDALFYRDHPKLATALDIVGTSHRAGIEGAKFGVVIGAAISVLQSALDIAQEKKSLIDAAKDVATSTAKAGALGYGTAFAGSAIKGAMQQCGNQAVRQLAKTSAPTLALSICLSLGSSVTSYVKGDISEAQFLADVGEKGTGMLSAGMMAALGQIAIPIPFVGAAIGGTVGYTLSSLFYHAALDAGSQADAAHARLSQAKEFETAARKRIALERAELESFMQQEFPELERETQQLFTLVENHESLGLDAFAAAINQYAELLGVQLEFKSLVEFDAFMASDQPLKL